MKIILNGKELKQLATERLPMLIHGTEGSGASFYTIVCAAKWFQQGYTILFLCGYPMAEEEFIKIVPCKNNDVQFFTQEKQREFREAFNQTSNNRIVFVKNIELFSEDVFKLVSAENNLVISGDVNESNIKNMILQKQYAATVYFSDIPSIRLPNLKKYEGYVVSDTDNGITKLES